MHSRCPLQIQKLSLAKSVKDSGLGGTHKPASCKRGTPRGLSFRIILGEDISTPIRRIRQWDGNAKIVLRPSESADTCKLAF